MNNSEIMKLTRDELDLAVANLLKINVVFEKEVPYLKGYIIPDSYSHRGDPNVLYSPSTNWQQGGKLIEEYKISIEASSEGWEAVLKNSGNWMFGNTALEAAMRALVMSK